MPNANAAEILVQFVNESNEVTILDGNARLRAAIALKAKPAAIETATGKRGILIEIDSKIYLKPLPPIEFKRQRIRRVRSFRKSRY